MKVLGYIPARSGSKGVPNKNILPISGVPLLEFSVATACNAMADGVLSEVVVSTDSIDYLALVKQYPIVQQYLRPDSLSGDESPTIDGVRDFLEFAKTELGHFYDAVMILQPTAPFRSVRHIKQAVSILKEARNASCVVSVKKLGDVHPIRIYKMDNDGVLSNFCSNLYESEPSRRQDFAPDAFLRNGCIYLTPVSVIESQNLIRGDRVVAFTMPEANSINVDEHIDFITAAAALEYEPYASDLAEFRSLVSMVTSENSRRV